MFLKLKLAAGFLRARTMKKKPFSSTPHRGNAMNGTSRPTKKERKKKLQPKKLEKGRWLVALCKIAPKLTCCAAISTKTNKNLIFRKTNLPAAGPPPASQTKVVELISFIGAKLASN